MRGLKGGAVVKGTAALLGVGLLVALLLLPPVQGMFWRFWVELYPHSPRAWHALGREALRRGEGERAVFIYRRLWARDPNDLRAAVGLAEALLRQEAYLEAFQLLKMVTGRQPSFAYAWQLLGDLYREKGSYKNAIVAYQEALRHRPRSPQAWYGLGLCYALTQQLEKAKEAFLQASRLEPRNPYPALALVKVYLRLGQVGEAERLLTPLVERYPTLPNTWYMLGLLWEKKGGSQGMERAVEAFQRARRLAPDSVLIRYELGRALMALQRWPEALEEFQFVVEQRPDYKEAHFQLAQVYRRLGQERAAQAAEKRFHRLSEFERQEGELRLRIGLEPDNPALRFQLAELYRQHEFWEDAWAAYQAVLALQPGNEEARLRFRELCQRLQRPEAIPSREEVIAEARRRAGLEPTGGMPPHPWTPQER